MSKQEEPRSAVEYIVLEKSLIGNEVHEAGARVKYDGLPAENLQPTCEVGAARYQEYLVSNAERVRKMALDHAPVESATNAEAFAAAVGRAIAEANAAFMARLDAIDKALSKQNKAKAKTEDAIA